MPTKNIFGTNGTLFIQDPSGTDWSILGELSEMIVETEEVPEDDLFHIVKTGAATLTIKARLSKAAIWQLSGLEKIVLECCPNKRVGFLILHGKKHRTRKKNLARSIRILEKEARR